MSGLSISSVPEQYRQQFRNIDLNGNGLVDSAIEAAKFEFDYCDRLYNSQANNNIDICNYFYAQSELSGLRLDQVLYPFAKFSIDTTIPDPNDSQKKMSIKYTFENFDNSALKITRLNRQTAESTTYELRGSSDHHKVKFLINGQEEMRQTTNLSNLIKELEGVLPKILNAEKKVYLQTVLRRLRVATMMLWE